MEFSSDEIIERIKSKVPLKNLESIGITPQIVSKWKIRNTIPRADDLYKIADYLNVSMEWLLTGEVKDRFNPNPDLPQQEEELLSNFRLLSDDKKAMFSLMLASVAVEK